jgi:tetratricopeptide (TPR) repeat protein
MKIYYIIIITLLTVSCVATSRTPPISDNARLFEEAKAYFDSGDYDAARKAYRRLAESQPGSPLAASAAFNAAYILVHSENKNHDYAAAEIEFNQFLQTYPQGSLAGEAQTWVAIIKRGDQSPAGQVMKEVEQLTRQVESLTKEVQDAKANEQSIMQERDSLLSIKENLMLKINDLISEKDVLQEKMTTLMKDRDALAQDKAQLQGKIEALTQDKRDLVRANKKLEKSLHDLTMVDVRMEKRRKKIKKEETIDSNATATK